MKKSYAEEDGKPAEGSEQSTDTLGPTFEPLHSEWFLKDSLLNSTSSNTKDSNNPGEGYGDFFQSGWKRGRARKEKVWS